MPPRKASIHAGSRAPPNYPSPQILDNYPLNFWIGVYTHLMAARIQSTKRVYTHLMEIIMSRQFFVIPTTERVYTHMDEIDDEPYVFEASTDHSPLDMDDPEFAYREYLAERFSR